jgi:hypothetical protein
MCFAAAQDVELNRQKEHRKITHGNDTDNKNENQKASGNRPPGRPEKEEKPLRVNPEGLLVDSEGFVIGSVVEGTYLMPARAPP